MGGARMPKAHRLPKGRARRSLERALTGRTVMVTGASTGIGRETAIALGANGARVLLVARSADKLADTQAHIVRRGGEATVYQCNLAHHEDIDRMVDLVQREQPGVDILINNAGRSILRPIADAYDRFHDYERTMALNYFAPVRLMLHLLPGMREQGFGHVVNISTMGVQTGAPMFSAYLASKAALDAFTRSITPEVGEDGVYLTTVHMPLVRTPMSTATRTYDEIDALSPQAAAEMIWRALSKRPKRVATGMGTFHQVLYAVSPDAQDRLLRAWLRRFLRRQEKSARKLARA